MSATGSASLLGAALGYARRGVPVFPCERGGKRPLTKNGFWEATVDERVVRRWWGRRPEANVGVPTGRASGLLVLDVDAGDGLDSIVDLELRRGKPPGTARARTGGGGEHLYFRWPAAAEVRNSQGYLGAELDVRGEGGYVLVPPSRTAGPYEWMDPSRPADAAWLLGCLEERARRGAGDPVLRSDRRRRAWPFRRSRRVEGAIGRRSSSLEDEAGRPPGPLPSFA